MLYGIDIGSNTQNIDWGLLKQQGIEFAIIKATQGNYRVNVHFPEMLFEARKAGLIAGLYHWCDPLCNGKSQGEYFLENVMGLDFDFAALDFEQYWADWKEWPGKIRKTLSPAQISEAGRLTALTIKSRLGSAQPIPAQARRLLIYTRASFVHDYASQAAGWIKGYPLWIAHWAFPAGRAAISWDDLFAQEYKKRLEPALPQGCAKWFLHQWSGDRFILPGMGGEKADLNRFDGSPDELRASLGLQPLPGRDELLVNLETQFEKLKLASISLEEALDACIAAHKTGIKQT